MKNDKRIEKVSKTIDRFGNSLDDLEKSMVWLDSKLDWNERWIGSDAVAKRFEVSFEYFWKMLKTVAEYQGTESPGPRPALQAAMQYGWIDNPDNFSEYLEARNHTVHDYYEIPIEEYLQIIRRFVIDSRQVLDKINSDLKI
jgi:nucleotidyltransferase substrate binding protein (TIGR01987 family)